MDRGAHFHKCDLQVHTPRDLNWKGQGAVSDKDRRGYAREFVAACRERGIAGVAITDHHDTAFFAHIKQAALEETDEDGHPLTHERRLVVFPGMELTLGVPCQALLILDAEFPENLLESIATALAVDGSRPAGEAKHGNPSAIDVRGAR